MPEPRTINRKLTTGGRAAKGGPEQARLALPAPVGPLWVVFDGETLVGVRWDDEGPLADVRVVRSAPSSLADPLRAYARGRPVDLAAVLPVDPAGTAFQRAVWAALRRVPRGKVRTYGGIASDVGRPRATRAVGVANGANPIPIVIPCHRIVGAGHTLGGYTGGLERKRALLALEGVQLDGEQVRPGQLVLF
ncbi:MAG: methylated-DNA--[protein]-cysteine S-methyltransferase [Myxococcales bacterium]|nr:methylated-DNA--[protein]-cysteine S-methyltransferase [Myxococcales bacterium]